MKFSAVFAGLLTAALSSTAYAAPANVTISARAGGGTAAGVIGDVAEVVGGILEGIEQDKIVSRVFDFCLSFI
jgi:uncharacterized protein YraI